MDVQRELKAIASLLGEPARAIMLWNLLDGKALTATELAICSDVSAQSASMHLNKLVEGELLRVESQGRHRYYRFAKPEVAYVVEAIANLIPSRNLKRVEQESPSSASSLKFCRTCYDHLAGKVGVMVTEQLIKQKIIDVRKNQYDITDKGLHWFEDFGISIDDLKKERRILARQCLDWSERRHHMAGALGAALLNNMLAFGWIRKRKESRAVTLTDKGQAGLYKTLKLVI